MRPRMILHIVRKDLRRHWIEISLFVLVCGAWAWQAAHPSAWIWMTERELVPIVLFGLWFIVTVRLIQGECLVGDREFWSTRPYRWNELMAAKVLALALCLNGPLLIAELFLLHHAGFTLSWSFAPGLLFLQLEFFLFITFTAATLATITQSLVQWLLTVGGMILYAIVVSWFPWDRLPATLSSQGDVATLLGGAIILPALVFAFVWQYARRRIWLSRAAVATVMLAVPATILIAPTRFVRGIAYPHPSKGSPLTLTIPNDSDTGNRQYLRFDNYGTSAELVIPVSTHVADSDTIVQVDGTRIALSGNNGWHWTSPWLNQNLRYPVSPSQGQLRFQIPANLADRLQQLHARATADLALEVYRMGALQKIATNSDPVVLPGVGICRIDSGQDQYRNQYGILIAPGLSCFAPLRLPGVVFLQTPSADNTCRTEDGSPLPPGHYASTIEYGTSGIPADFDPDPVHAVHFNMGLWNPPIPAPDSPRKFRSAVVCRGTPLLLRTGSLDRTLQTTIDLGLIGNERRLPGHLTVE